MSFTARIDALVLIGAMIQDDQIMCDLDLVRCEKKQKNVRNGTELSTEKGEH